MASEAEFSDHRGRQKFLTPKIVFLHLFRDHAKLLVRTIFSRGDRGGITRTQTALNQFRLSMINFFPTGFVYFCLFEKLALGRKVAKKPGINFVDNKELKFVNFFDFSFTKK
jgi:hypothetical protein